MNIGLVNEMAIVCDKLGVDVWEVIDAAATKPFGFMKFTPGPGIGGHCIPLDPHYLAWKMRTLNYKTRFIDLASEINTEMPAFVVAKVAHALNDERKAVNGSRAFWCSAWPTSGTSTTCARARRSTSSACSRSEGATVAYHDPYVPTFREDGHDLQRRYRSTAAHLIADGSTAWWSITDHSRDRLRDDQAHALASVVDTRRRDCREQAIDMQVTRHRDRLRRARRRRVPGRDGNDVVCARRRRSARSHG